MSTFAKLIASQRCCDSVGLFAGLAVAAPSRDILERDIVGIERGALVKKIYDTHRQILPVESDQRILRTLSPLGIMRQLTFR